MAPPTTNYAEIQQDEIEALRSIYMEQFQEDTPKVGAWNVSSLLLKIDRSRYVETAGSCCESLS